MTGRLAVLLCAGTLAACNRFVEIGQRAVSGDAGDDGMGDDGPPAGDDASAADTAGDLLPTETAGQSILWHSDLETGDFTDWQRGGAATGGVVREHVQATVVTGQSHDAMGTHAVRITFDTSDGQADHMAELYRRVETTPAYYSAWFFIDSTHTPAQYWTIFYFFYQRVPGDTTTRHGLWDVNIDDKSLYFYDEPHSALTRAAPVNPYPVGRWFHVEAYFAYQPERKGRIKVWLDGQQILDLADLGASSVSDNLYWGIGSDNDMMTPSNCTIYVDDATISTQRLGP